MRERGPVLSYYAKILPFYEKESIARAHLTFWTGLARRWRPRRILEIGSGLGQITQALGRRATAVGVDISMEMLELASRRRSSRSRASFVAADMCEPVFGGVFDLIVAPNDPFSHLTALSERRQALKAVAGQLSRRGRFVLDGLYRPERISLSANRRVPYDGGELSIRETWRPIGAGALWRARYAYRDRPGKGPERRLAASFVARSWDAAKIRSFFASCGLSVKTLWGDWNQHSFSRDSRRLIVVARRSTAPLAIRR